MSCPYCEMTSRRWTEGVEMGVVCFCNHPANGGEQGYVRGGVPAGRQRPSTHCRPDCRFLAGTAVAEQWRRERNALDDTCCGG